MKTSDAFKRFREILQRFLINSNIKLGKVLLKFIERCVLTIIAIRGKVNFLQLGRFSDLNEKTFRNNFSKKVDWLAMNANIALKEIKNLEDTCIVLDPAHISKAGNCTPGIGMYWSGVASAVKHGLEIVAFAVVDYANSKTIMLGAVQTMSDIKTTMTDFYIQAVEKSKETLMKISKIICADAYFSRKPFVDAMRRMGFVFVSRLQSNCKLFYLPTEAWLKARGKKQGPQPKYAGRVDLKNPDTQFLEEITIEGAESAWTGIVQSNALEIKIRIVIVKDEKSTVVFFSTDTNMLPEKIVSIYRKRFQIEFGIRDARQFTGLHHSQARDEKRLDFAFNISFFTRNVLQTEIDRYFPSLSVGQLKKALSEEEFALQILKIALPHGVNDHIMRKINELIATYVGVAA